MKLIIIDGNEANVKHKVGVSVYTLHLLHEFKKYASNDLRFCVYLRDDPGLHMPKENQYFRYRIVWGPILWLKLFLPIALYLDELRQNLRKFLRLSTIDLYAYFAPAHYAPSYIPKSCKLIVTVHDLAYILFPKEFLKNDLNKLTKWTAESVFRANKVITVSQNTKKDVMEFYKLPDNLVKTVHNGYSAQDTKVDHKQTILVAGRNYGIEPYKYFLYVGTLQPRKNLGKLLYAFAMFAKEKEDYRLVIAGKEGWMYDEILNLAQKLKIEKIVHFVGYVSDQDKAVLYSKATSLVFPSLYEGFGLPILEAFSAGCPVISSNSSCLPEIAGNGALYFDPQNPNDILNKMREIESSLPLRHNLIEAGERQLLKFSWETCGKKTLEVILS